MITKKRTLKIRKLIYDKFGAELLACRKYKHRDPSDEEIFEDATNILRFLATCVSGATFEETLRLLKKYKKYAENPSNPIGVDSFIASLVEEQCTEARINI